MRIIIEDDHRFQGAGPSMGIAGQPAVAPQYSQPMAQQASQYSPPPQIPQPIASIQSAGEPAGHIRQFVNTATNGSTVMPVGVRVSGVGGNAMPSQIIDIGPAPEWLKSLRVTAAPVSAE